MLYQKVALPIYPAVLSFYGDCLFLPLCWPSGYSQRHG